MRVSRELTVSELEELRGRLYHQLLDDGNLDDVTGMEDASELDVPIEFVIDYYSDYLFVEEDFFCNL